MENYASQNMSLNETMPPMGPCGGYGQLMTALQVTSNFRHDMTVAVNGYLSPLILIVTVITNGLVCLVLVRKNMRSPTNWLLVMIALADTMTGLFPIPVNVYFLLYWGPYEYIPYNWCKPFELLTVGIPTVVHTVSIWLTVCLALQRYIYVCYSFQARTLCTTANVVKGTIAILIISTLFHTSIFIENEYHPITYSLKYDVETNLTVCCKFMNPWFIQNQNKFFPVYYWSRIIFIHFLPCAFLIFLNAVLIRTLKEAKRRRQLLLRQNKKSDCKKLQDSNCTTLMLVAVVAAFLIVEMPLGMFFIFFIVNNQFDLYRENFEIVSITLNFLILVSYPINFFIYAGMSRQFRETFKNLFMPKGRTLDREQSQYMTLAENGKTTATTETAI